MKTPKTFSNRMDLLKKFMSILFSCVLLLSLSDCKKKDKNVTPSKKESYKPKRINNTNVAVTEPTAQNKSVPVAKPNNETTTAAITPKKIAGKTTANPAVNYKIYNNLRNILSSIKTGQTLTKEQLLASKKIPDDACKTIKSITKVSENELIIKWKSKWMLEKISDVRLKDDRIKVELKNGLVYTSGNAIGIEYEDKVYTNLTIKGDRAYIPSIKKYSWKIGS